MAREDLSKLSNEVLRLCLQNLNLPITGSHSQLVQNLRAALGSNAATAANEPGQIGDRRVLKPHSGCQRVQRTRSGKNCRIAAEPGVPKTSTVEQLASYEEVDEFSDAGSSVDDLLSPQPCQQTQQTGYLLLPSCRPYRTPFCPPSQRLLLIYLAQGICRWISRPQVLEATMHPIFCISPNLPIFSSGSRTHPQAPRVPR